MQTYTVVGATSDVGNIVAQQLENMGHEVRKVSRSLGFSIDDEEALLKAFSGADGAYVMIPIDMQAPDLHKREEEIGEKLTKAIQATNVKRVVLLSSLSGLVNPGSTKTSAWGALMMEDRLNKLNIEEFMSFRCAFFMENFIKGLGFPEQAKNGSFVAAFRADVAMPMIACTDIAEKVIEALTTNTLPELRTRELQGARDYTMAEATHILATAIGIPKVEYRQVTIDEAHHAMIAAGVSPSFAEAVMETAISFNKGNSMTLEKRSPENTTETTLEQWAMEQFGRK
ncbi:nucleotide-diphosphate-sugar epimerase [Ktedonobacter sp. SOSP1-52]|uniref:NmrA family NAD(P)-binding protein n=1 Tax=Ktedonobacter sp. SOSP1-52 TaxID=2778366 RepID=UPI001916296E|nr:NmrA family NAD(P)-binding protein [Ktedonobacter sp. SOSP1-52]GHO63715.1 nucleotide-diphosphate-sugar epimerase [Ktedonobacter sp. SOSP1-52]